MSFRADHPSAWQFQRNTSRWAWNSLASPELNAPTAGKEDPLAAFTPLPPPAKELGELRELLIARSSCRRFDTTAMPLDDLSTLLWATYGVTGRSRLGALDWLDRPLPSGGGLYPLEVYALANRVRDLEAGIYHYVPALHGLELVRQGRLPDRFVSYLFMGQPYPALAPLTIVLTSVVARSLGKYGDRGLRYVLLEAGHAMQSFVLAASALGLGTCELGGFLDDELAATLRCEPDAEVPLYAASAGRPADADRAAQRAVDAY
ncbi:SagB/ThcOx family dehydrogenase [Actinoplanes sp. TBRC 11911]|uniref:SagB/ThcOx family dehydrogenase n=1 Tax=Actinoplanes sp. TBRC 11911 TaxID=2729386 RepID=UPI00145DF19E|nr:SagB/ThcOx family dehydrogenase [Actinoplanes sp. TBRC 11911]NMO51806.1 SagB/ThcOx family dehydrogenase [Actinoplanes sp. TBRC 11911]